MTLTPRESSDAYLDRCLAVLGAFDNRHRARSVGDISERADLPTSTTYRLVTSLERLGLVERQDGKVALGMRLFEIGQLAGRGRSLRDIALPFIADLRAATGQTVQIAVLDGSEVVYLEIVRSDNGPRLPSRVGGRLPAYATGLGKALLATLPPERLDEVLPETLAPIGPNTVSTRAALDRQLERVRANHIAFEEQESGPGIVCAACAIIDHTGVAVGAVSASGWVRQMNLRRVGPAVHACALGIQRNIGKMGEST